jgi:hypothetical protein
MQARGDELAREASRSAVDEIRRLREQAAFDCLSPDPICVRVTAEASRKLSDAAKSLHPQCLGLIATEIERVNANVERVVRIAIKDPWVEMKRRGQEWQTSEQRAKEEARLKAQADAHQQELARVANENQRKLNEERQRAQQHKDAEEWQRIRTRPRSLTELLKTKSPSVGDTVWLYPGDKAAIKYRVLSLSSGDTRLELAEQGSLTITKKKVTKTVKTGFSSWWIQGDSVENIPFYFDGSTMGIVFTKAVTVHEHEAIYLFLPLDTTIADVGGVEYAHLLDETRALSRWANMGEAGTYSRGPRLESNHV